MDDNRVAFHERIESPGVKRPGNLQPVNVVAINLAKGGIANAIRTAAINCPIPWATSKDIATRRETYHQDNQGEKGNFNGSQTSNKFSFFRHLCLPYRRGADPTPIPYRTIASAFHQSRSDTKKAVKLGINPLAWGCRSIRKCLAPNCKSYAQPQKLA